MIEADSKAVWNLPFFVPLPVPLPELSLFSSTLLNFRISGSSVPYYSDFHGAAKRFSP